MDLVFKKLDSSSKEKVKRLFEHQLERLNLAVVRLSCPRGICKFTLIIDTDTKGGGLRT